MKVNRCTGSQVALVLLLSSSSLAAHDLGPDEALRLRHKGVIAPLEHVLGPAFERYPGSKLLDAELEEHEDRAVRYIYEIELLTADGVVREIELDARTGELLKDKEDD